MATIIEGAYWTITEEAAELLVERGILKKCDIRISHSGMVDDDYPVYHYDQNKPQEVGFLSIHRYIRDAEKEVENLNDRKKEQANVGREVGGE